MDRKSDNVAFEDKTKARRAYANMILFFQRLSTTQLIIKDKLFLHSNETFELET